MSHLSALEAAAIPLTCGDPPGPSSHRRNFSNTCVSPVSVPYHETVASEVVSHICSSVGVSQAHCTLHSIPNLPQRLFGVLVLGAELRPVEGHLVRGLVTSLQSSHLSGPDVFRILIANPERLTPRYIPFSLSDHSFNSITRRKCLTNSDRAPDPSNCRGCALGFCPWGSHPQTCQVHQMNKCQHNKCQQSISTQCQVLLYMATCQVCPCNL